MNKKPTYVENIVIGKPLIDEANLFAFSNEDWTENEQYLTYWTNERFLPRILVELGFYPSISEIRRNKPELVKTLDSVDFFKLKVKKKRYVWIAVGEENC